MIMTINSTVAEHDSLKAAKRHDPESDPFTSHPQNPFH